MNGTSFKNLVLGFLAGAIATVAVHELVKYALFVNGYIDMRPWSLDPNAMTGLPQIANDVLCGGAWGVIFALVLGNAPVGSMTVRGAILGIFGPALLGYFFLQPYLRGEEVLLGGNFNLLGALLLISAAFGAAAAWLYGFLTSGLRLP